MVNEEVGPNDLVFFIDSSAEPSTDYIDSLVKEMKLQCEDFSHVLLVAVGGGTTLDCGKAASVGFTNGVPTRELQGWDLASSPGLPKIGVPTLSGTGAEASRTAVLTDLSSGLKLGINSDFSRFDGVILDPALSSSVPRDLYFYTGLDAYMHAFEILRGRYRNDISDHLARLSVSLIEDVFDSKDPLTSEQRGKVMYASYFAGLALTSGFVGLLHPVSAAIGVMHKLPHGLSNVLCLMALSDFYPEEQRKVEAWAESLGLRIPKLSDLTGKGPDVDAILELMSNHTKPLTNHFGDSWKEEIWGDTLRTALGEL
jgi:3-deoxy-alpha-D-manno-octulosonate 8-oxidase